MRRSTSALATPAGRRAFALVLAAAVALVAPAGGRAEGVGAEARAAHDLHIAYADLAIEGNVIAGRIRMFRSDLERALGPMVGADALTLQPGSEADALVLRYIRDHLRITVPAGDVVLEPELVQSGEDELDREPVWWVVVQYRAPAAVGELRVRNTLLMELFKDERNIMKFVRFPEETQKTFYFARGEEETVVEP